MILDMLSSEGVFGCMKGLGVMWKRGEPVGFIDLLLEHSEVRETYSLQPAGCAPSVDAKLGHTRAAQFLRLAEGGEVVFIW